MNPARPTTRPLTARPAAPAPRPAGAGFQATLGGDEYTAFCEGVRAICAVDLLQYKRGQMERRIKTWVERREGGDLRTYLGRLRKEPRKDGLSTIEAAATILSVLEKRPDIAETLNGCFERMLARYRQVQTEMPKLAPKP